MRWCDWVVDHVGNRQVAHYKENAIWIGLHFLRINIVFVGFNTLHQVGIVINKIAYTR